MSATLASVAKEEFDGEVKHAYQGDQTLRGCVKTRLGVVGDKYDFRLMGKGMAHQRTAPSADVIPMNISHALKVATLTDWEAPEYTDVWNAQTVNFDEVKELAITVAGAMGRKDDQSIITAASATTNTFIDASFTLATLTNSSKLLNKVNAPFKDRFFCCDEDGLAELLATTQVGSSDFNQVQALINGTLTYFMGFNFKIIGSGREEGGLGGNAYAWHKDSIGHAVGIDMKTRVDWSVDKGSWLTLGLWKAGSILIDGEGCIKITAS